MLNVGQAHVRVDGPAKVSGSAAYAADVQPEGLLHAIGVRSTIALGRITDLDDGPARCVPGVVAVYSHLNAPQALAWRSTPEMIDLSAEGLGLNTLPDGEARRQHGWLPLAGPEIFFAGQWVAVVVATSIEAAAEGASKLRIRCAAESARVGAPSRGGEPLRPGFFFGEEMQVVKGAPVDGVAAHAVVDEVYSTPMQHHQPMEPSVTMAQWLDGELTLRDSTQGVAAARNYVACSLGIAPERVRVLSPFVGGGFGSKNQMWPHQALAAHIARALDRPVRLQLSRADMSVACGHRADTSQAMTLKADAQGRLLAIRHLTTTPTSLNGGFFEPCGLNTLLLYPARSLEVRHLVERRSISTPTPFRGPGETPGSFALESAMDELAHRLELNPLELRRRNLAPRYVLHDRDWSSNHLLECYERGAVAFGWPHGATTPRSRRDGAEWIGLGMATTAYPAPALAATVRVRISSAGPVTVETSATDIGTGMYTVLTQVVADELGLPAAGVSVHLADSRFPAAPTAGRSKSTASVAPAAQAACRALLARLAELGGGDDDDERGAPLETMRRRLVARNLPFIEAEGTSGGSPAAKNLAFYSFGAHFVEVRVDESLGRVRVSRVCSAFDCGRIVNPMTAASQIKGGIVFGIGMALMEQTELDPRSGRIVNDNLADYRIPVNSDVPEIEVLFIDKPDHRFNELGVRGLGEIAVPGLAAAIANAIFDATGRRHRNLPIVARDLLRDRAVKAPTSKSVDIRRLR